MTHDHGTYSMPRGTVDLTELGRRLEARFPTLSNEERRIALAVFEEMAGGHPAATSAIGARAHVAAPTVARALDRWPGVYRDDDGRVIGFWGLSLEETGHSMRVDDRVVYGWCAWDTLFLGELLGAELHVESSCPVTGGPVRLVAGPGGVRDLEPGRAVLSFVDPSHCDVSGDRVISSFCHHILFFRSRDDWREWTTGRTPRTFVLTIEEGWRLGRITNRLRYGDALGADRTTRPVEEVR